MNLDARAFQDPASSGGNSNATFSAVTLEIIPEPASGLLLLSGLAIACGVRPRHRDAA